MTKKNGDKGWMRKARKADMIINTALYVPKTAVYFVKGKHKSSANKPRNNFVTSSSERDDFII